MGRVGKHQESSSVHLSQHGNHKRMLPITCGSVDGTQALRLQGKHFTNGAISSDPLWSCMPKLVDGITLDGCM